MAPPDWVAWRHDYAVPNSNLSRRLAEVQRLLRDGLNRCPQGAIRLISMCAGQGHDVLGVLRDHPRAVDVTARLVEWDERNVALARQAADGLARVEITRADAGVAAAYRGMCPANVVLVCGVFGNISDADIDSTVEALPSLCAPGATVVWTRHRGAPDRTPLLRKKLIDTGFEELDFVAPHDARFGVGANRFIGDAQPFRPDTRLFAFAHGPSAPAGETALDTAALERTHPEIAIHQLDNHGEAAIAIAPRDSSRHSGGLILYYHGLHGTAFDLVAGDVSPLALTFTAHGYVVAAGDFAGDGWGNDASLDAAARLWETLAAKWSITNTFSIGASMGGVPSLLSIPDGRIPVDAWIGISPVCDLRAQFLERLPGGPVDRQGRHMMGPASSIAAAYAMRDASTYDPAATAGHDPMTLPPSAFGSVALRFYTPPNDYVVDPAIHAATLRKKLQATRVEADLVEIPGQHGGPEADRFAGDMAAFFTRHTNHNAHRHS